MSTRSMTPGGALLRASRVFAIPPPLPKPAPQLSSGATFTSPTSTLPHPIRLSITTPQTSLMRGDWGFKRPLPLRSTTKTSTPLIRVEAIDTYEHITEYASAADHTLNMQKWLEMSIPLTVPIVDDATKIGRFKAGKRQSVFEDEIDYTTAPVNIGGKDDIRWKFKGPYLANQTEGEFLDYVSNEVRKQKSEFQEYLRNACATELTTRARRAVVDEEFLASISPDMVTQEQLTAYIKELRVDRASLYNHIRAFLDLPPVAPPDPRDNSGLLEDMVTGGLNQPVRNQFATTLSPYAKNGPPKTHPSAGLSYIRSSAYTANHPEFGPQKKSTTIKSRVIKPRGGGNGALEATLGVAGVVTPLPAGADSFSTGSTSKFKGTNTGHSIPGAQNVEPLKVGGSKTHVHPAHATISSTGQIMLVVESADPEAIAVLEGTTDQIPPPPTPVQPRPRVTGPGGMFGGGYGLGPERSQSPFAARPSSNDPTRSLNKSLDSILSIE